MRTVKAITSLLFLSAVCVGPAHANWFSDPHSNTMLNIGSAPNPTPEDLRRIGDSRYAATGYGASRVHSEIAPVQPVPAQVAYVGHDQSISSAAMFRMEGKTVYGTKGARLGHILTVDHGSKMADLQTPGGIAVAMPVALLVDKGNRIIAPTTSKADVTAMAKTQTGRTVAINVSQKTLRPLRG
jgi:hypothetical protein